MLICVHSFKVWGFAFGLRPHTQRSGLPLLKGVYKIGPQRCQPPCLNIPDADVCLFGFLQSLGGIQVGHEPEP
jgi:hypothetical protein